MSISAITSNSTLGLVPDPYSHDPAMSAAAAQAVRPAVVEPFKPVLVQPEQRKAVEPRFTAADTKAPAKTLTPGERVDGVVKNSAPTDEVAKNVQAARKAMDAQRYTIDVIAA
jgi:hypothetical protein